MSILSRCDLAFQFHPRRDSWRVRGRIKRELDACRGEWEVSFNDGVHCSGLLPVFSYMHALYICYHVLLFCRSNVYSYYFFVSVFARLKAV